MGSRLDLAFIAPGKPWKNGYVGSVHSRKRDDFLNVTTLPSLLHARVELTDGHHEYKHVLRHSSPGYKTSTECAV